MKVDHGPAYWAVVESHPTGDAWRVLVEHHYAENGEFYREVVWAGPYIDEDGAIDAAVRFNDAQLAS